MNYKYPYLADKRNYWIIVELDKYLKTTLSNIHDTRSGLVLNDQVLLAKNKTSFRLVGVLDWAHYTAKGLANAINTETIDEYYLSMLQDDRSPPNNWRDAKEETYLKEFYKNRSKQIIPDGIKNPSIDPETELLRLREMLQEIRSRQTGIDKLIDRIPAKFTVTISGINFTYDKEIEPYRILKNKLSIHLRYRFETNAILIVASSRGRKFEADVLDLVDKGEVTILPYNDEMYSPTITLSDLISTAKLEKEIRYLESFNTAKISIG